MPSHDLLDVAVTVEDGARGFTGAVPVRMAVGVGHHVRTRAGARRGPRVARSAAGAPASEHPGRAGSGAAPSLTRRAPAGKGAWKRVVAALLLVPAAPVLATCAIAIKVEGIFDRGARGPVFFREQRVGRGRVFELLKFRTLDAGALASLGDGPTHIARLESFGHLTRSGAVIKRWYLDELPQLLNIVRGEMGLVGTRPYPIELYEEELAQGITRKRDMPAGLVGPVQSRKGSPMDPMALDAEYWEAYRSLPTWRLFLLDLRIVIRSLRVLLEHKGI